MNIDSLWSAYYDDISGNWGGAAMVKVGNNPYDRFPKLAMDNAGNGLLVWIQGDTATMDTQDSTYGASFTVNQPLKPFQLLEMYTGNNTDAPAAAMAPDGSRGVAIWVQRGTGSNGYDLVTSELTGGTFKAPEKFMTFPSFVSDPAVVIDQTGTLTAVWSQPLTSNKVNLVAARRPAGQAWGSPTAIETTNQSGGFTDEDPVARVGKDAAGNVIVAWSRKLKPDMMDNNFGIVARRFSAGMWEAEKVLAMKDGLTASDPELAVSENGRAVVGFVYFDIGMTGDPDTYNMFAALFK
jgi:hypothetical protein